MLNMPLSNIHRQTWHKTLLALFYPTPASLHVPRKASPERAVFLDGAPALGTNGERNPSVERMLPKQHKATRSIFLPVRGIIIAEDCWRKDSRV